jgi:hypothetical protein
MTNSFFKPLFLIVVLFFITCSTTKFQTLKKEDIVKSYITARNNYDIKKVNTLIDKDYYEIFIDGSMEIENKEQLVDGILWGKELDSNIKLLDIKSDGETVITIEEITNYIDVALKRKSRKFKIVYTFLNNKIQNQKIDTLPGYYEILKFNADRYEEFVKYCDQNNLNYSQDSLNPEFGSLLRKVLEKYKSDNE